MDVTMADRSSKTTIETQNKCMFVPLDPVQTHQQNLSNNSK